MRPGQSQGRGRVWRLTCGQAVGLERVGGRQLGESSRDCERVGEGCSGWKGVEVGGREGYSSHLVNTWMTAFLSILVCSFSPPLPSLQSPQFPLGLGSPPWVSTGKTHLQRQARCCRLHQLGPTGAWGPGRPPRRCCDVGREVSMQGTGDQGEKRGKGPGDGKPCPARWEELSKLGKARLCGPSVWTYLLGIPPADAPGTRRLPISARLLG